MDYEEYKKWCQENGRLPKVIKVRTAKEGEIETEEQIERRLAVVKRCFCAKNKFTEEEERIKRLYEELDEQYKEKSVQMQNYEEYKLWCDRYGRLPRTQIIVNGKIVRAAKKGEKETEEQIEQKLGKRRQVFYRKKLLTEEEEKIKRLYEELDELYGKKQSTRKLAQVVKDVPIAEAQEAFEFLGAITKEKEKEGASHNDE